MGLELGKGEAPVVGVEEGGGDPRGLRIRRLTHLDEHNLYTDQDYAEEAGEDAF